MAQRHPGCVDREAAGLCVLEEHVIEAGRGVLGLHHDGCHVVGKCYREHSAEVQPRRLEAGDDVLGPLRKRRPHELVPADTGDEDQRPAHPVTVPVGDETQSAEVDLNFDTRRRIIHRDRYRSWAGPTTFHRETSQGPMRDDHATAAPTRCRS
jgi:hypothetical protein